MFIIWTALLLKTQKLQYLKLREFDCKRKAKKKKKRRSFRQLSLTCERFHHWLMRQMALSLLTGLARIFNIVVVFLRLESLKCLQWRNVVRNWIWVDAALNSELPFEGEPAFSKLSHLSQWYFPFFLVSRSSEFLRPTDSRPVRLGIGPPFGIHDQIYLSLLFSTDNYFYSFSYGILSDEKMSL
jgi:hypothetical protein